MSATDSNGVSASQTVTYTVLVAPQATIKTPVSGAVYVRNTPINANFSCSVAAPVQVVSCVASTQQGAPIVTTPVGSHTFTLTVKDSDGVTVTSTATYTVVSIRPQIQSLRQAATRWLEHRRTGVRLPLGTTFEFTSDQKATVTLTFRRSVSGRLAAGRCVAPKAAASGSRPCLRNLPAGVLTFAAQPGANNFNFSGRTSSGPLPPGSYVVRADARRGRADCPPPASRCTSRSPAERATVDASPTVERLVCCRRRRCLTAFSTSPR